MKLSTQEGHGLARLEGISAPNVAKIMRLLRRTGFVSSMPGQAGGYVLTRSVADISVGEVLSALGDRFFDASFCARHAGGNSRCAHLGDCSIRPVPRHLQEVVDDVLGRLTLEQLLCSEREMSAVTGPTPSACPRRPRRDRPPSFHGPRLEEGSRRSAKAIRNDRVQ